MKVIKLHCGSSRTFSNSDSSDFKGSLTPVYFTISQDIFFRQANAFDTNNKSINTVFFYNKETHYINETCEEIKKLIEE